MEIEAGQAVKIEVGKVYVCASGHLVLVESTSEEPPYVVRASSPVRPTSSFTFTKDGAYWEYSGGDGALDLARPATTEEEVLYHMGICRAR